MAKQVDWNFVKRMKLVMDSGIVLGDTKQVRAAALAAARELKRPAIDRVGQGVG